MEKIDFAWSKEKNEQLKRIRGITFEEIVLAVNNDAVIEIIPNPSANHPNQHCYVLDMNDYIYLVPFVQDGNKIFLKTIYPSRKHKNLYLPSKK